MLCDKSLKTALLISAVFHTLTLCSLSYFRSAGSEELSPDIKVMYVPREEDSRQTRLIKENTPPPQKKPAEETAKTNTAVSPKIEASLSQEKQTVIPQPAQPVKQSPPKGEARIEIPPELPKEDKQLYLDYYQSIREKIRRYVLKNCHYYIECGEVCLFFILSSEGSLQEINVLEQRSSQNVILRGIAKRSLLQAAPFLPFPQGLDQPRLSFNVTISFETE